LTRETAEDSRERWSHNMRLQPIQPWLLSLDWFCIQSIQIKVSRGLDLIAGKENTCRRSP
jgi:hypothetical protein